MLNTWLLIDKLLTWPILILLILATSHFLSHDEKGNQRWLGQLHLQTDTEDSTAYT